MATGSPAEYSGGEPSSPPRAAGVVVPLLAWIALVATANAADRPTVAACEGVAFESLVAVGEPAGLTFVAPGSEALVTCRVTPEGWELRARGADGKLRGARVPVPDSPTRLAALPNAVWALIDAAGLRGAAPAVVSTGAPPVPTPPPVTVAPPVATAPPAATPPLPTTAPPPMPTEAPPVSAPPVTTEAPPVTTEAPPVATEAPPAATEAPPVTMEAPPVTPPPVATEAAPPVVTEAPAVTTDTRPAGWLAAAPSLVIRPSTAFTTGIALSGGARLGGAFWLGALADVLPTRALASGGAADAVRDVDLLVTAAWSPTAGRVAPHVGVGAGVASHTWSLADALVDTTAAPLVALDAGVALRVFPEESHLALVPLARVAIDLAAGRTGGDHPVPVALSPVQAEVGVVLRATLPPRGE